MFHTHQTGRALLCALAGLCLFTIVTTTDARDTRRGDTPQWRYSSADRAFVSLDHMDPDDLGRIDRPLRSVAVGDTTVLGSWTFESGTREGWTSVDITDQVGIFFHVDDFAGLGGGDFGRLVPIEGNQSLWCGARPAPGDPALCSYAALPGYGDKWEQFFITVDCEAVSGDVTVDYRIAWDSEPGYDHTTLQYDRCDDDWVDIEGGLGVWDGVGSGLYTTTIPDSVHSGLVRLRFRFRSDVSWSDADGRWDTDGAVILDSLTVSDAGGVVVPTEDFEAEAVGAEATLSGRWTAHIVPGYGDYAALISGYEAVQEDPCLHNASRMWSFYSGSTANYACGGWPGQAAVPYENARGQYIHNEIWSPWIPLSGGATVELAFDVYEDLPLNSLVFWVWHVRSRGGDLCDSGWRDRDYVYSNPHKQWVRKVELLSDLIEPGATEIQVALGVVDECGRWCGVYGTGACHSHAPLFDNIEVRAIDETGPQWSVRDIDLFQDTFADDGTTTGTARIDAALDILPPGNPGIRPGDSTAVTVVDLENGLAVDPHTGTGPAVYAYVSVHNGIDPYSAADIQADAWRWPVVDSLTYDSRTWYCVRMDTAYGDEGPEPNRFCVDLNDSLFVPGDTVQFFFGATSAPPGGETTYWTPFTGTTLSMTEALEEPDECTILPAGGSARGGEILYVDGFNGLGAQPFFDTSFGANGVLHKIDRYDVRGPRELAGNRPGARVVDVSQQLLGIYRIILWNTGDLDEGNIGDGDHNGNGTKSDDAAMLLAFLDGLEAGGGIFFSGDNIAGEWPDLTGAAIPLRDTYIQHTLVDGDHEDFGMPIRPLVIGEDGGVFDHVTGPDTTYAFGWCTEYPDLADFDVLAPTSASTQELRYDDGGTGANGAAIAQYTTNPNGQNVGVMLWGFSFHSIRDDVAPTAMDRFHMFRDIALFLGELLPIPVAASSPSANHLAQNVPNPFNPVTSIEFSLKERAPVTLRIYNVRGQRVKTLVNEVRAPGVSHRIEWDGRNDAGQRVASGVYFYRLVTKGFAKTKKMVLLK